MGKLIVIILLGHTHIWPSTTINSLQGGSIHWVVPHSSQWDAGRIQAGVIKGGRGGGPVVFFKKMGGGGGGGQPLTRDNFY